MSYQPVQGRATDGLIHTTDALRRNTQDNTEETEFSDLSHHNTQNANTRAINPTSEATAALSIPLASDEEETVRRNRPLTASEGFSQQVCTTRAKWAGCNVMIVLIAFFLGYWIGYQADNNNNNNSNSTTSNKPLVIMISFDGTRPDYINSTTAPRLYSFLTDATTLSSKRMQPSYPSITFPNHYTLVTGVHPETHGVVGNSMHDPQTNMNFSLGSGQDVINNPIWWGSEPIWLAASRWGLKTGSIMWPGTGAKIQNTSLDYLQEFDHGMTSQQRVDKLLSWFDGPAISGISGQTITDGCEICLVYFDAVDSAGHSYGPFSPQVLQALQVVDQAFGALLDGLESRGLSSRAHILTVSDHGMSRLFDQQHIFLDQYIANISDYGVMDIPKKYQSYGACWNMHVKAGLEADLITRLQSIPNMKCWLKDNPPNPTFHFAVSDRVGAIQCLANEGWAVTTTQWGILHETGIHGYDPTSVSMSATFGVRGPLIKGGVIPPTSSGDYFTNRNVFPLLAHLLSIPTPPNNGTLEALVPFIQRRT